MICQHCKKAPATVRVDDVKAFEHHGAEDNQVEEHMLCEVCAQSLELPTLGVPQQAKDEVWKLLQKSAANARERKNAKPVPTCGSCGLTLEQLRRKGRVGCEQCYTAFDQYLEGLLERMHGSCEHRGRTPGVDADDAERRREIEEARVALQEAVDAEEFERAAELRDRLLTLTTDLDRDAQPRAPEDGGAQLA